MIRLDEHTKMSCPHCGYRFPPASPGHVYFMDEEGIWQGDCIGCGEWLNFFDCIEGRGEVVETG